MPLFQNFRRAPFIMASYRMESFNNPLTIAPSISHHATHFRLFLVLITATIAIAIAIAITTAIAIAIVIATASLPVQVGLLSKKMLYLLYYFSI